METATKSRSEKKSQTDKLKTGINANKNKAAAEELNELLADEVTLYLKTWKFHWNIVGEGFHALHLFLEEQYTELRTIVDEVAERIRKIGHFPKGTMKQYLKDTALVENEDEKITPGMLIELADDHAAVARRVRDMFERFDGEYEDIGTADMLNQLVRQHEKMAWMLRSSVA